MTRQRPPNSSMPPNKDPPNLARDGGGKQTVSSIPASHGMRSRTAQHTLMAGFSNPLDDSLNNPKAFLDGKAPPPHPSMVSSKTQSERGTHKGPDHGSDILANASRLGRPKEITDNFNRN